MSPSAPMFVLIVINLISTILGQPVEPDVCLWNVVNDGTAETYTWVNGLYEYAGDYLDIKPIYNNNNTGCNKPALFIYFKLQSWYIGYYPTGDAQTVTGLYGKCISTDVTIQDPTGCDGVWEVPFINGSDTDSEITAYASKCPAWTNQCTQMETAITRTASNQNIVDNCDGTFTYDADNVYSKYVDASTTMYWFFNYHAFQWICSETLNLESCAFGSDAAQQSYNTEYWTDLDVASTTTLDLKSGDTLSITCLEVASPTRSPTKSPLPDGDGDGDSVNSVHINPSVFFMIVSILNML